MRNKPTQTHLDPALSLVECSVRVSSSLARLVRKCAMLEAGGTSAHDALLEPIHKVVESEESVVIPSLAPASLLRGAECGSLNTAVRPTAMACATRMI